MDRPLDDRVMSRAHRNRGLKAAGKPGTASILVLEGRDSANPQHFSIGNFKLAFSDISINVLMDILDPPGAQQSHIIYDAYEDAKSLLKKFQVFPAKGDKQQQRQAQQINELEAGGPTMMVGTLIDVVDGAIAACQRLDQITISMQSFRWKKG